jgi:ABC-type transport system involved in Fe-S cluster assembly fused permease/ATPase subunit
MPLAGDAVWRGAMSVGDLVRINADALQVCLPLNALGFVYREARDARVNAEHLFALLREQPDIAEAPGLPRLRADQGEVVFDLVSFHYDPGVGPQDTTLFNDTIGYNIAYGHFGCARADVVAGAGAAHVRELITSLPRQYDTPVGERAVKLSGGEKQRIAIARAVLKNPPILIFDETTSALDSDSEHAIEQELDRLARDRTSLITAHRLSTIVRAHGILVIDRRRIVEPGTHRELLRRKGLYSRMRLLLQRKLTQGPGGEDHANQHRTA